MRNKIKNREPVPSVFHPMTYKRLFSLLRSKLDIHDEYNFQAGLNSLLKGLHFKYGHDFYLEHSEAKVAAFISQGLGFSHYLHPVRGKVVSEIYGPGEIVLDPDAFFNGKLANSALEFVPGSNILYVTRLGMDTLFEGFDQAKLLTINTLASMFPRNRDKDELRREQGKEKIRLFFTRYPMLLKPARKAPMKYRDIASYLNIDQYHFSSLMGKLYPDLNH